MEGVPYLDAASALPLHPAARTALVAALDEGWADPARLYREGRRAALLLDGARASLAAALGARPDEVSFTASGTQSVHLAVLGGLAARRRSGRRFVTSAVEHSSVLQAAEWHRADGGEVTVVDVDPHGRVDVDAFADALGEGAALASLQTANHEVGTRQPVREVAERCAAAETPLHVDAGQSVGREPVDVAALGASLLSASAHKWGGPPGVGVLVVRRATRWRSPLPSDERESGRVPGYVNLPGALAAAAALEARVTEMAAEAARLSALVERIRAEVGRRVADVAVVGHPEERLPHLVTFSCLYVDGEALVTALDRAGFSVSSGSSCTASTLQPSHVLEAMGVLSHGNVRVSLHAGVDAADVEAFLDAVAAVVPELRRQAGADRL